jgi:P27 family predicted phage terminase small subunit
MGSRGPAKKNPEDQARRGNPGKRKLEVVAPVQEDSDESWRIPERPDWLTDEAIKIWDETIKTLLPYKLIGPMDGPMLARYCESLATAIYYEQYIEENGVFIRKSGGTKARRPEVKLNDDAWKRVEKLGAYFGLTPKSRLSMNVHLRQPKTKVDAATERKNRILGK